MATVFASQPSRAVFGKGSLASLADEAAALGCGRLLVVCTGSQIAVAERAVALLGPAGGPIFPEAAMHTPVEVTENAMAVVKAEGVDGVVAIGGGSAIGLAKAISLRTNLPQIAVPTTYAGSEMTPVLGQTEAGRKTTQRTIKVMPETVIYDVELSLSLPVPVSITSGFNAIAHGTEALYAETHAVLLPHILAYNTPEAQDAIARLGRALGASYPADALYDLAQQLGAPTALKDLGLPKASIEPVAEAIAAAPGWNPRAPDEAALKRVLHRAYKGERPRLERGAGAQAKS